MKTKIRTLEFSS